MKPVVSRHDQPCRSPARTVPGVTPLLILAGIAIAAPMGPARAADPTIFTPSASVRATIAGMRAAMKPGQGFMWKPIAQADGSTAALEYWRKAAPPAVHPDDAEYTIVIEGAGTMVSGGTLVDPVVKNPQLTEGSRIEGGTTRPLAPGDVILIPAGTPHWFGITGDRLVLLGVKLPKH